MSPAPCQTETLSFAAQDGRTLSGRLYLPAESPRAAVLVGGAYAVPQRYYARFAEWLAGRGLLVLTFDYRGVGDSRTAHPRQDPATLSDWGRLDLDAALGVLRSHSLDLPQGMVCHSFGGQALGLAHNARYLDAAICLGSGLGAIRHWQGPGRLRIELFSGLVVPGVTYLWGYLPAWTGLGEDLPAEVGLEWVRWLRSHDYLVDHQPAAVGRFRAVQAPVRLLTASDDDYCPEAAALHLASQLPDARVEVVDPAAFGLDHLGHFGYFRSPAEPLWEDLVAWLDEQLPTGTRAAS